MIITKPLEGGALKFKLKSEFPSNYNVLNKEITIVKAPAIMSIYEPAVQQSASAAKPLGEDIHNLVDTPANNDLLIVPSN